MRCGSCGYENGERSKFCSECGTRTDVVSERASRADGERRVLTVMFCDLASSTELSQRLDPEDLRDLIKRYQAACVECIVHHDGHVAQYLGDGILAYFGYPSAHEDDSARAVRAGLDIVRGLDALNAPIERDFGLRLALRIGLHRGEVVVGEVGAGPRHEILAVGETSNIAARVQGLADQNCVLITHEVFLAARGSLIADDLGPKALKGVEEPVRVYAVRGERGTRGVRPPDDIDASAPFCGREEELAVALGCSERSVAGAGQVLLVSGDPGIGKSRLLRTLQQRLSGSDHRWLECCCTPYFSNTALQPIVELQQQQLGFTMESSDDAKLDALEAGVRRLDLPLETTMPLLAELHGADSTRRYPALGLSMAGRRRATLELVMRGIFAISEQHPVVWVVEDLHWIDPTTLELLTEVIQRIGGKRLLLVLTFRPEFEPPFSQVPDQTTMTSIALGSLHERLSRDVVRAVAGNSEIPQAWISAIVERAEGVPLFLEEMTKHALEHARSSTFFAVPTTLQDLLMARLDRLGPARDLAQLCSVVGRETRRALLQKLWTEDEDALEAGLASLVASELMHARHHAVFPAYRFKHALIQDTAYNALLKSVRRQYHLRIADALERYLPETATLEPERLAHHLTEGAAPARAVVYWLLAGQHAMQRSAHHEAIRNLRAGLACVERMPETVERLQVELTLQMSLSVSSMAVYGYAAETVRESFERARVLCDAAGGGAPVFPVLFGLWLFYLVRADRERTCSLAAEMLQSAEQSGDPAIGVQAHIANSITCFYLGQHARCLLHAERTLALYDRNAHAGHKITYGDDPGVYGHIYSALPSWFLGEPGRAKVELDAAHALAVELEHPFTLVGVEAFRTQHLYWTREYEALAEQAARTEGLALAQGFPLFQAVSIVHRSPPVRERGDARAAVELAAGGLAFFRATGAQLNVPHFMAELAEAQFAAGDLQSGLTTIDEAIALTEKNLDVYFAPELHRIRAELLAAAGQPFAVVTAALEEALRLAHAHQAYSLAQRALGTLVRLAPSPALRDAAQRRLVALQKPKVSSARVLSGA
jgi:class 3 adenylate cyclase/predicted ATPase